MNKKILGISGLLLSMLMTAPALADNPPSSSGTGATPASSGSPSPSQTGGYPHQDIHNDAQNYREADNNGTMHPDKGQWNDEQKARREHWREEQKKRREHWREERKEHREKMQEERKEHREMKEHHEMMRDQHQQGTMPEGAPAPKATPSP